MLIPVTRADFRKIVEPDCQTDFSCLHLFPTKLANQTDGLAQGEHQGGFVIMLILRQGCCEMVVRSLTSRIKGSFH